MLPDSSFRDSGQLNPHKQMSSVKRLVIISASAGVGLALAMAIIAGAALWYSSRPERPKPWNSKTIVATFDYPGVEGEVGAKTIVLYYTLENTTDLDYRMPHQDQLEINSRLRRENSLSGGKGLTVDSQDTFIPARQRKRFAIHVAYPMNDPLGPDKTKEDRRKQWQIIANFMKAELPNLNGFVIFDPVARYEIVFPNGWDNLDLK